MIITIKPKKKTNKSYLYKTKSNKKKLKLNKLTNKKEKNKNNDWSKSKGNNDSKSKINKTLKHTKNYTNKKKFQPVRKCMRAKVYFSNTNPSFKTDTVQKFFVKKCLFFRK